MIYGNEGDIYKFYLNGKEFFTTDAYSLWYIYIVDFDENDKSIEVVIKSIGANDYTIYSVFSKNGDKMQKKIIRDIPNDGGILKLDKKGKIVIDDPLLACINPEIYTVYYEFKNGGIEQKIANMDKINNLSAYTTGGLAFSTEKNLKKYEQFEDEKKVNFQIIQYIKDGAEFGMFQVKLEDGRQRIYI